MNWQLHRRFFYFLGGAAYVFVLQTPFCWIEDRGPLWLCLLETVAFSAVAGAVFAAAVRLDDESKGNDGEESR
jgi:hypothetical protein